MQDIYVLTHLSKTDNLSLFIPWLYHLKEAKKIQILADFNVEELKQQCQEYNISNIEFISKEEKEEKEKKSITSSYDVWLKPESLKDIQGDSFPSFLASHLLPYEDVYNIWSEYLYEYNPRIDQLFLEAYIGKKSDVYFKLMILNYYQLKDYLKAFQYAKKDCELNKTFLSFENLGYCIDKISEKNLITEKDLYEELRDLFGGLMYFYFKYHRYYEGILQGKEFLEKNIRMSERELLSYVSYILSLCYYESMDLDRASYYSGQSYFLHSIDKTENIYWKHLQERWPRNRDFTENVFSYIKNTYGSHLSILDIGPGAGHWGIHSKPLSKEIDAVEAYLPNIKEHDLDKIYNENIIDYEISKNYDVIILGDVLEHFSPEDAFKLLNRLYHHCKELIVVVPFYYWQGSEYGNPYEIHKQPDLSEEVMSERYPMLQLLISNSVKALYIKNKEYII